MDARAGQRLSRYLPHVIAATALVAIGPLLFVWALSASGVLRSIPVSIVVGMALSFGAAYGGAAIWRSRLSSGDLLFGELMLWGWLRRVWIERRVNGALRLLDGLQAT